MFCFSLPLDLFLCICEIVFSSRFLIVQSIDCVLVPFAIFRLRSKSAARSLLDLPYSLLRRSTSSYTTRLYMSDCQMPLPTINAHSALTTISYLQTYLGITYPRYYTTLPHTSTCMAAMLSAVGYRNVFAPTRAKLISSV